MTWFCISFSRPLSFKSCSTSARVQDLQSFFWSEAEVNAKLESVMRRAFTEVHESARKHRTQMRTGAYCLAVGRVADATLVRGLFP
jgi:glutamate dehydrogenase (NAD(P)+)